MKQEYIDLLYLIRCTILNTSPSIEIKTDIKTLYGLSKMHSIEAFMYPIIEKVFEGDSFLPKWKEACDKVMRKLIMYEFERNRIIKAFEEQGIWFMLMKGVVLQYLYPNRFHRQMTDNDILFDINKKKEMIKIMETNGFKKDNKKALHDIAFSKDPFYCFEMHFKIGAALKFIDYFEDLDSRLVIKSEFERCLSIDDMYIHLFSHELKHYEFNGVGIRSLIDHYYFTKEYSDKFDMEYINRIISEHGYIDYETNRIELFNSIFMRGEEDFFDSMDNELLVKYCGSGTHGSIQNSIENKISEDSSVYNYYFSRIIPEKEWLEYCYPFVSKHKFLIPFFIPYRLIKGLFKPKCWRELGMVLKVKRNKD